MRLCSGKSKHQIRQLTECIGEGYRTQEFPSLETGLQVDTFLAAALKKLSERRRRKTTPRKALAGS